MYRAAEVLLLALIGLVGCRTAHDVAETSAHVATAPVRFVGRQIHGPDQNQDITNQIYEAPPVQQPVYAPPPTVRATPPVVRQQERAVTSSTASSRPSPQTASATPPPAPRTTNTSAAQFPVAKPVPGKPGYVFSPYDPNGGYVDVTGYQSGSKVKDPYSQKIFLVP
jgi:hypothetical protein